MKKSPHSKKPLRTPPSHADLFRTARKDTKDFLEYTSEIETESLEKEKESLHCLEWKFREWRKAQKQQALLRSIADDDPASANESVLSSLAGKIEAFTTFFNARENGSRLNPDTKEVKGPSLTDADRQAIREFKAEQQKAQEAGEEPTPAQEQDKNIVAPIITAIKSEARATREAFTDSVKNKRKHFPPVSAKGKARAATLWREWSGNSLSFGNGRRKVDCFDHHKRELATYNIERVEHFTAVIDAARKG